MNLRPFIKGAWMWCCKHAPKLLAGTAIAAEALGFYFMHKEAPVVNDRLKALPEGATWKDKFKAAGPVYLPAAGMLVLSAGCIIGGCTLGEHRVAMMASLYSASEAVLRKYEEQAIDKLGKEKAEELHKAVAQEVLEDANIDPSQILNTGKGNTLFYDPLTGRAFRSSIEAVKNDSLEFKKYILNNMWGSVNDWYDELGIEHAKLADIVGWNVDHNINPWYQEGSYNGELCWVIRHLEEPVMYNGKQPKSFDCCEACYPED